MRLCSWNVNGFRAVSAKEEWQMWTGLGYDVYALQEVKAYSDQIPAGQGDLPGYQRFWFAAEKKKGYSGVACYSRLPVLAFQTDLPDPAFQGEGRLLQLEYPEFYFLDIYFPNGQMNEERLAYKLGYYEAFLTHAERLRQIKPVVVCGDFNTAHRSIDLARPKENEGTSGFLPIERAFLDRFVAHGYLDTFRLVHGDEPAQYSWWSYRLGARARNVGWRIDYFFVSAELQGAVKDAWIATNITGSDHCPVGLELPI